jgi:hypothetical protein
VNPKDIEGAFRDSTVATLLKNGPPQGQAKRQHFTPQLILRRFLVAGASRLCQLDVRTGQTLQVTPAAAASRRRFYTMRDADTNERDESIEGLLGVIESATGPALEHAIQGPEPITSDERVTLSYFAAAQLVRTPAALARALEISKVLQVAEMARFITDEATFNEAYEAVRSDDDSADPAWLQDWMREALLVS